MKNINKNIELFFVDLDGTTLDIKKQGNYDISNENLNQIKETIKTKKIVISTGRMDKNVQRYINLMGINYAVIGNGSQVINKTGKVLLERTLSREQILSIVKIAKIYKCFIKVNDQLNIYGAINKWVIFIIKMIFIGKISKYKFKKSYKFKSQKYFKIVLFGKSKSTIQKILKKISKTVHNVSVVSAANGWILEITNINATKGIANEFVAKKIYKINNKNKTAHIGDTMNDSTTIGHVGRLIVMKNASKKLKKLTKYLGPSYKKAGLAKILCGKYKIKS